MYKNTSTILFKDAKADGRRAEHELPLFGQPQGRRQAGVLKFLTVLYKINITLCFEF